MCPLPGDYTGAAFVRRISRDGSEKIANYEYARKKEPQQEGLVKVYSADNYTA